MQVNKNDIEKHLNVWQKTLRLCDWDINIKIVEEKWRKSGDIKIDLDDKKAILMINQNPKCTNLEELVIHELLHLKLYPMDQMIEELIDTIYGSDSDDIKRQMPYGQFMTTLESTVEDLTKGYLKAAGITTPLSFGRIKNQVDDEINAGK